MWAAGSNECIEDNGVGGGGCQVGQRQAHLGPLHSPPPMAGPQTRPWGPNGLASLQSVLHAVLLQTLYHTKALHFTSRSHSHCLYSKPRADSMNSKLNFICNFSLHFWHSQQHHHNQPHHQSTLAHHHGCLERMACGEVRWLRAGWNWCAPPKNSVKNWVIAGRTGGGELLSEILPENTFSLSINVVTDLILFSGENDPKCQLKWWEIPFDLGKTSKDSIYIKPNSNHILLPGSVL